jgi:toxin ParE1/3/4
MRAHFTPQAEIDLEEIGDQIALDNSRRAVSFIREMQQRCEEIAEGPHHYVVRPDLQHLLTVDLTVKCVGTIAGETARR